MRILLILLFFTLISCDLNDTKTVNKEQKGKIEGKIKYHKPDYKKKDSLSIFLSSGIDNENITEYWALTNSDIRNFEKINLTNINIELLIRNGKEHLLKELEPIKLKFSEISIQNVETTDKKNEIFIGILSFEYRENMFQMIPILLDGTIILSSNQ
ncbi:hypothetical protein [Olleya sp. HaHaR_3_96]|uniref:hypothetical protein n=1 Tax=Olleya sp. HaHaR_3_96 TaxID=2745560 RepID=UPI001C4F19E1|nr:hypothetical protein [Olleya sp. HaHaR_3_96]QXP59473.1 hypothetical protein H0I26_16380 [Olleya sp. HaHaR_3_96]